MPVPAQHGGGCQWRPPPLVPLAAKDEEVEGRRAMRPRSFCKVAPSRGGKGEAAAGGEGRRRAARRRAASGFPNERLERKLGIVQVKQGRRKFVNSFF